MLSVKVFAPISILPLVRVSVPVTVVFAFNSNVDAIFVIARSTGAKEVAFMVVVPEMLFIVPPVKLPSTFKVPPPGNVISVLWCKGAVAAIATFPVILTIPPLNCKKAVLLILLLGSIAKAAAFSCAVAPFMTIDLVAAPPVA